MESLSECDFEPTGFISYGVSYLINFGEFLNGAWNLPGSMDNGVSYLVNFGYGILNGALKLRVP